MVGYYHRMLGRWSNNGSNKYKIIDVGGSEISLDDLFEKYFFNEKYHTRCSVVVIKISKTRSKIATTLKETL